MASRPPERIDAGPVALRRHCVADAEAIAAAVSESLDDLRVWMPWATAEAATVSGQRARLAEVEPHWDQDTDYSYVIVVPDRQAVVGGCGLHRRIGPGAIEIGYWVGVAHQRRGYASAAAAALTDAALGLDGIERVEIHCDLANTRSRAIPHRLGYRLDRVEPDEVVAPGEVGQNMVWLKERA